MFRRTLMYLGLPNWARWYDVARPSDKVGSCVLVYLRRREGVSGGAFRKFVNNEFAPALAGIAALKELRTQTFLPWTNALWDTPNVAHDNPPNQRFHASVVVGFGDAAAQAAFFEELRLGNLPAKLAAVASAAHGYQVSEALTFVRDGKILPHYES